MNRQIKFRVWSKQSKSFIKPDYFAISLDGTLIQHIIYYGDDPGNTWDDSWNEELDDEKYEVQQFIGLSDKNGVEIYEGDIVKWDGPHESEWLGCIEYAAPSFIINWSKSPYKTPPSVLNNNMVIKGNIFQNQELLVN